MPVINPTLEQLAQFEKSIPDDKPIVMLNLLRFREVADYPPREPAEQGQSGKPATGREAYQRYSKRVMPFLWEVGGQPLWMGKGRHSLIAPEGETRARALLQPRVGKK